MPQPDMSDVHVDGVLGTKEKKKRKRKKKLLADLKKHYGPGAHESGSEQTSHGRGRGGGGKKGGGSGRKSGSPPKASGAQAEQPGQNLRDLHDDEGGHKPFKTGSEVKRPLEVEARRPKTFENFDGQEFMRKRMQVAVEFAKEKGTMLRHHLFAGPTGLGKTTMAKIVASEMGANLKMVNAPKLSSVDGITSLLTGLEDGDVLFIDEIHALSPAMQDVLLPAMESGVIDVDLGVPGMTRRLELADFTLLGATTDPDQLNDALKNRFQTETFKALNPDEIGNIVSRNAQLLGLDMDEGAVAELSGRAQGVPRNAISHLDTVHRYNTVIEGGGPITADVVDGAMRMEQVDSAGLDFRQRAYLNTLDLSTRAGMGTGAISRSISQNTKTVSADVEPYLVASKFIQETAQGKAITPKGRKHLADLKAEGAAEFLDFITKRWLLFPIRADLKKHKGPSAHESGSEQTAHGRRGGGGEKGKDSPAAPTQSLTSSAGTADNEALNQEDEGKPDRDLIDNDPQARELAKGRRTDALQLEETTTPIINDIAEATGGETSGFKYRVKTERSLRKKIVKDAGAKQISMEEAAAAINDATRYTLVWPGDESYVANLDESIQMFADQGWGVFDSKDKNGFAPGDHYGGINVNLTNGQGNIMEVQFHTPKTVELKAQSHPLMKEHESLSLDKVGNAPRLREIEAEVTEIWNGDLSYIPPGAEDWGTPTVYLLGKQIASNLMEQLDYWVRSDTGETVDVVLAVDPETKEVVQWTWATGEWELSEINIFDLGGLGGSADYTRISDKLSIEMTRGNQGDPMPAEAPHPPGEQPAESFSAEVEVAKADDYKNLVFGWASVAFTPDGKQILDRQGHAIDVEDLEDTAYDFSINSRGSGDMHKSDGFGQLVESMVLTNEKAELMGIPPGSTPQGWWVGFKVPPEYHESVRSGERTMFSIEGTARLEPLES